MLQQTTQQSLTTIQLSEALLAIRDALPVEVRLAMARDYVTLEKTIMKCNEGEAPETIAVFELLERTKDVLNEESRSRKQGTSPEDFQLANSKIVELSQTLAPSVPQEAIRIMDAQVTELLKAVTIKKTKKKECIMGNRAYKPEIDALYTSLITILERALVVTERTPQQRYEAFATDLAHLQQTTLVAAPALPDSRPMSKSECGGGLKPPTPVHHRRHSSFFGRLALTVGVKKQKPTSISRFIDEAKALSIAAQTSSFMSCEGRQQAAADGGEYKGEPPATATPRAPGC